MNATLRIARYEIENVVRNRWVIGYGVFFFAVTEALLRLSGDSPRALLGLFNIVVLVIPLVTIVFGAISWHGAREFTELLLAQPVTRRTLFQGLFAGLVLPLAATFAVGVSLPFLLHRAVTAETAGMLGLMVVAGMALTAVFGAIAVLIGGLVEDRLKGLGVALGVWLMLTLVYDGLVLLVTVTFPSYPLEGLLLALTFANPVDLARVLLVLELDVAALMGYTGAVFNRVLGDSLGTLGALAGLALWAVAPGLLAMRAFTRKDF